MDKITKLPWEVSDRTIKATGGGYIADVFDGTLGQNLDNFEISRANAKYICRSVNSHEGLLEAAKATMSYYKALSDIWKLGGFKEAGEKGYTVEHDQLDTLQNESFEKLKEAIQKAQGHE